MKYFKYIVLTLILAIPVNTYAGADGGDLIVATTDTIAAPYLSAYYDLRERSSYIQITKLSDTPNPCQIHIQIFQHDRGCSELNFFDTLTPNDTVVYDLDNLIRNNGSPVPANLNDDSYGYVVIIGDIDDGCDDIVGNFRIVDDAGYEYRTNMPALIGPGDIIGKLYSNFNTVDGANQADIVGYSYFLTEFDYGIGAINNDFGFDTDIFVFDLDEEPLSCDRRNFACGNVMNYGVNEDYPNSKGGPLLCPGGGLADPNGGYVLFDNWAPPFPPPPFEPPGDDLIIQGFTGINNGNGTGSMDSWYGEFILGDPSDMRLKDNIKLVHTLNNGINLYSFKYSKDANLGDNIYVGVMAQDLNELGLGNAVVKMPNGYYGVNYSKLGLRMATLDEWYHKGLDSVVINNNY